MPAPPTLSPPFFYRFKNQTHTVVCQRKDISKTIPVWVVGFSPFDAVVGPDGGMIVRTQEPRFTARWGRGQEAVDTVLASKQACHVDDDLAIVIYDLTWLDHPGHQESSCLDEAALAVGRTFGDVAELTAAPEA